MLVAQVTAAPDIGPVRALLLRQLDRAAMRQDEAETLLTRGETRQGRAALRHALRWMTSFVYRVSSLTGRQEIGSETRVLIVEEARSIRQDMQTLVRSLAP
jgi:hypothetical protein